jgi:membrane fusion protein, copper/silver efflux system
MKFGHSINGLSNRFRWLLIVSLLAAGISGYLLRGSGPSGPETEHLHHDDTAESETWTCSMHPRIQQPNPGDCPICGMDLIPVGNGGDQDLGPAELQLSERARKLAEVVLAPVERKHLEYELRLPGTVTVAENSVQRITSRVAGRLDRLLVATTGTVVKKGQPLVEIYSGQLIAAQEELIQAFKGTEIATGATADLRAGQLLTAAREKLVLLGLTTDQVRGIEESGRVEDQVSILAPQGGVVLQLNVVEGEYVGRGTPICTIADLSRVWVMLDAYAEDLPLLALGQTVKLQVPSLPGQPLQGELDFIDPVLNAKTRTARLRVEIGNDDGLLKPGTYLHGTVLVGAGTMGVNSPVEHLQPPLVIPATAPLISGRRAVVYVADMKNPGRYEGREVVLGPRLGDHYLVREGLSEGEQVVTRGNFKLDSALQIKGGPSMMNPPGQPVAQPAGHHHGQHVAASAAEQTETGPPPISEEIATLSTSGELLPVTADFLTALEAVYDGYFALQFALSHDDHSGAVAAAANLKLAADPDLGGALDDHGSHRVWGLLTLALGANAEAMAATADLDAGRTIFEPLSRVMTAISRSFGRTDGEPVYNYFCPMAFDYEGAFWLQEKEGTENPYYGSGMFKCGTKQETIVAMGAGGHE